MKNLCCGYRIRESCAGSILKESKTVVGAKVPVIESAESPTKGVVMKWQNGKLKNVLDVWKPDIVILVLGTNYVNAHDELISILKTYNKDLPVIWVGAFDKEIATGRNQLIQKAITGKSNCLLVKSDSILDANGMKATHFFGKTAKKVAEAVVVKFEPFMTKCLSAQKPN
jgi:chemotaxis response regulator CheB